MLFLPPCSRDAGQGLVEYSLVILLVAIVVIAIITIMGPAIGNLYSQVVAGV